MGRVESHEAGFPPLRQSVRGFLVEHDFEYIGPRSMLLNANTLSSMPDAEPMILLAIEDITEEDEETLRSFAVVSHAMWRNSSQIIWRKRVL